MTSLTRTHLINGCLFPTHERSFANRLSAIPPLPFRRLSVAHKFHPCLSFCTCTTTTYVFYEWMLKQNASDQSPQNTPTDWARHEFALAQLADKRQTKRLQMIAT